jgi:hypothetical protein
VLARVGEVFWARGTAAVQPRSPGAPRPFTRLGLGP